MPENSLDKLIINLSVCFAVCISSNATAMAAPNEYDDLEESTAIPNIADQQDIGVFVLSKVLDEQTGKPVGNVEVFSSTNKTLTDQNGEFLLKVDQNGYITLKKENYKETTLKVSDLRGKIKLEPIPKYLPIFPNLSADVNYRNLGFSEKLDTTSSSGRFSDSFSIDASAKVFNSIIIGLNYENIAGILNRSTTAEKANLSNHFVSLKGAYVFNLFRDNFEAAAGVKAYWNNISLSSQVVNQFINRETDFLDFGSQRIGIGIDLNLGGRPIRYTPLVINAFATYYPLVSVSQPEGGLLPANLTQLDFGVSGRYDFSGVYLQAKYLNRNIFQGNYNSNLSGIIAGIGYGF